MNDSNLRVVAARKGPPSVLRVVEEAVPEPGAGEVLVRVAAAGVAWADVMGREGIYPGTTFPLTPGYDIAGRIEACGADVPSERMGQAVAALTVRGGYARYVVIAARDAVPVPGDLDPAEVTSLVLNYVTAYQMLERVADVAAGDWILVHGAAGGVGTALLQLARLRGIRAVATASAGKHDLVESLGAVPIDYRTEDVARIARARSGGGVLAAFDPIGGDSLRASYTALRPSGTLVTYGASAVFSGGRLNALRALRFLLRTPRHSSAKLLADSKAVAGYNVATWRDERPERFAEDLTRLCSLLGERAVEPVIADRLPLRDAAIAHERLGRAEVRGKLVLIS